MTDEKVVRWTQIMQVSCCDLLAKVVTYLFFTMVAMSAQVAPFTQRTTRWIWIKFKMSVVLLGTTLKSYFRIPCNRWKNDGWGKFWDWPEVDYWGAVHWWSKIKYNVWICLFTMVTKVVTFIVVILETIMRSLCFYCG